MSFALTQLAGFGGKRATSVSLLTVSTSSISTDNTTGSYTFSGLSIGAATVGRRVLVGFVASDNGTSNAVVSATIGGVSATIVTQVSPTNASNAGFLIAQVDTGTTADVVITGAANCWQNMGIVLWAITGLSSDTPTDTAQVPNTTTTTPNADIDCSAGGIVFAVVGWRDPGTPTTTVWSNIYDYGFDDYIDTQLSFSYTYQFFTSAQSGLTITATGNQAPAQSSLALCSFSA